MVGGKGSNFNNKPQHRTQNNYKPQNRTIEVDLSCFDKGLRDEKDILRAEILLFDAKNIAEDLGKSRETRSQIRGFYAECKAISFKIENVEEFEYNANEIWLLKSKVAYKFSSGKIKNVLYDFLNKAVDYIYKQTDPRKQYEAFFDFMKLFEAVVGYSYKETREG
ncbi:MAG: type III-A CRISPR-associated protein Csm2 [Epulopiscium sp. Nele67-Bin005]|nr:MAG: type III-A CRISPR-associated protein Csm2 [Epulopiscium sp. Nele67-Bin005]